MILYTEEAFSVIKMIIKMNNEKIKAENEYTLDRVYSGLTRIFKQFGYSGVEIDGNLEYKGNSDPRDFGKFGCIYNGLRKQTWFINNAYTWLLCNSDDVEDPNDFSVEDLLSYDGSRVKMSANIEKDTFDI